MAATVVTFYSYKGGVGRTQALANVAVSLANQGQRVILIDMDLESPGLHNFFSPKGHNSRRLEDADLARSPGLLEYLEECSNLGPNEPDLLGRLIPCAHEAWLGDRGGLHLLPPGRLDESYTQRVSEFSWESYYRNHRGAEIIERFRECLCDADADFVLIDSRTGMTDVASVCTFQLPDYVIVLLALHQQGIDGARRIGAAIAQSRGLLDEAVLAERKRKILYLPTRIDESDDTERSKQWLERLQEGLHPYGEVLYRLDDRIPHSKQVAYGEQIVTFPGADTPIARAYQRLTDRLLKEAQRFNPRDEFRDLGTVVENAPSEHPASRVVRLRSQLEQLLRDVQSDTQPLDPATTPLGSLTLWVERVVQWPAHLRSQLDRLRRSVDALELEHTSVPPEVSELACLAEWQKVGDAYLTWSMGLLDAHLQVLKERVKEELRSWAMGDIELVAQLWPQVEALLNRRSFGELEAHLPAWRTWLSQNTLTSLLRRDQLEFDLLERRYGDKSSHWLDERLERFDEEFPFSEKAESESVRRLALTNLLSLQSVHLDAPASSLLWARYDYVCQLASDQLAEHVRLFERIGQPLWLAWWNGLFAQIDTGREPFDLTPPAAAAQRQLERLAENPCLATLAETIAARIAHAVVMGHWSSLQKVFEHRRQDTGLRRGISKLSEIPGLTPGDNVRLLGMWLGDTHPGLEPDIFADFLRAMVKQGRPPEALVALGAVAQDIPEILDLAAFDVVFIAAVSKLILERQVGALNLLIGDGDFVRRIEKCGVGRVLLLLITAELSPAALDEQTMARLRRHIIEDASYTRQFKAVGEWIELRSHNSNVQVSPTQASQLRRALQTAEADATPNLHKSAYYSAEFSKFWEPYIKQIMELRDDGEAVKASIEKLDCDSWIDSAVRVISGRTNVRRPDGIERQAMLSAFRAVKDSLYRLLAQRSAHRGATFAVVLSLDERRSAAGKQMTDWLVAQVQSDPLYAFLSPLVT